MYEKVEKSKENKSRVVANSVAQTKSNVKQGYGFVDNRPEQQMQNTLNKLANISEHVSQLVNNNINNKYDSFIDAQLHPANSGGKVLQLASKFNEIEKKAKSNKTITIQEVEVATTEIVMDLVKGKDYKDSDGSPVEDHVKAGINYDIGNGNDYAAAPYYISLPDIVRIQEDIKNGVYKMAISHEMSHYIRTQGTKDSQSSFPKVEPIINAIEWDVELNKYPGSNGNKDAWKEEVRADLKGIQLEYNASRKLPSKSKIDEFGKMLGNVVDHDHPPASVRVSAMKDYVADIKGCSCCYLTTACVEIKNLPDNCEELTLLREFRDNYLMKLPNGHTLFDWYYEYAPEILASIERSDEKLIVFEYIYEIILDCVRNIKQNNMEYVFKKYCEMVINLKEHFLSKDIAL